MCDEKGCSAEEKEMCMAHYDQNGKWKGAEGK
jgi:K(+)-stimulated pyrophosphate-energized sodium pump